MKNILFAFSILVTGLQVDALTASTPAEHAHYNAVVFLSIPAIDTDGSDVTGYCNGTLVSRNVIVTAAHCVVRSRLFTNGLLKVEVGEYRYSQSPNGPVRIGYRTMITHLSAVSVRLQPGVNPNGGGTIAPENDFAIITLKNEVPISSDFIFPKIWNQPVGSYSSAFVVTINPLENISNMDTKRGATLNQIQFTHYMAKSTSGARVQEGDSGAPLFIVVNNVSYIVGVVKGRAQSFVSNYDVFAVWGNRF